MKCRFCENPESILCNETCCTGCDYMKFTKDDEPREKSPQQLLEIDKSIGRPKKIEELNEFLKKADDEKSKSKTTKRKLKKIPIKTDKTAVENL
jgi:hypothetical protein